jgi:hypothetical protein
MRKLLILSAALAAGALSLPAVAAQQPEQTSTSQQTAANEGQKVTGTVTNVDQNKQEITIDGQKYQLLLGAGAGLEPQVGAKVTAYYEERNGQKTITRIGQAE